MLCFLCLQLHNKLAFRPFRIKTNRSTSLIIYHTLTYPTCISEITPALPFCLLNWLVLLCLAQTPRLQTFIKSQNKERGEGYIDKTLFPLNTFPLRNMNFSYFLLKIFMFASFCISTSLQMWRTFKAVLTFK